MPEPINFCTGRDCVRLDTRMYQTGYCCPDCTPARRAGKPEPDTLRYCAPSRCYCGKCPSWRPLTSYVDQGPTVLDVRAIASGKRRSSPEQYRAAQQAVAASRGR